MGSNVGPTWFSQGRASPFELVLGIPFGSAPVSYKRPLLTDCKNTAAPSGALDKQVLDDSDSVIEEG